MAFQVLVVVILYNLVGILGDQNNNVCRTIADYAKIKGSENCWYNPDLDSTPEKMVQRYGFKLDTYTVTTGDGYVLTLFRIGNDATQTGQPIFIHHGIMENALCFMSAGKRSLAYFLARQGYDVWLGNLRGTGFSSNHTCLSINDREFWDFSFHEAALYDLPAYLEYIFAKKNQKLIYIGYSMGTSMSFIYSSLKKDHAGRHLKGIIALAPVTSLTYTPITKDSFSPYVKQIMSKQGSFVLNKNEDQVRRNLRNVCSKPSAMAFCVRNLFKFVGKSDGEFMPEDLPMMFNHFPARTSTKCVTHCLQIMQAKTFQRYDYGAKENKERYGSEKPLSYPLNDIVLPVYLYYGKNDFLSNEEDAYKTFKDLGTPIKNITSIPTSGDISYNHIDFIFGRNMELYLYPVLNEALQDLSKSQELR